MDRETATHCCSLEFLLRLVEEIELGMDTGTLTAILLLLGVEWLISGSFRRTGDSLSFFFSGIGEIRMWGILQANSEANVFIEWLQLHIPKLSYFL